VSYRRTLVFLIIFAVLAVFYYFYEIKGGETRRLAEEHEKLLFSFGKDEATRLTLEKGEDAIVLEKRGDEWEISAPVSAPADDAAVEGMLDALTRLKYERDIGPRADLQQFGLSGPELAVEVASGQETLGKLSLGADTSDGSKLYMKLSDREPVFTAGNSIRGKLDKDLFELRDKTVFDFSPADVAALTMARGGELFAFETPDEIDWRMTFPEEHRADAGRIRALLDSIRNARVKKFVEEEAEDLDKYGLASPSARIELSLAGEAAVLYFGAGVDTDDSGNVFARRNDSRQVIELSGGILDRFSTDIDGWRDRTLLLFDEDDAVRLEIVSDIGSITVERSGEDEEEWKVTGPGPGVVDDFELREFLAYLSGIKVTRFVHGEEIETAKSAVEKPLARLELRLKDVEAPLILLLAAKDDGSEAYAKTEPAGQYSVVDAGLLEEIASDPEKLKDRAVIKFEAADLEKIEIVRGEQTFSIARDDVRWELPEGIGIEEYEVDRFLWDLGRLDYSSLIPREGDDASYGFDSPSLTIKLSGSESEDGPSLVIGKKLADVDSFYALGADEGVVMEIDAELMTKWGEKF